jgi:hypothetical protein
MGTKRVGWARIKSLINENANALKFKKKVTRAAIIAATTLTSSDLGSVIMLDASASSTNFEITLPASPAVGDILQFVVVADSHSASEILLDSGSGNKFQGYALKFTASAIATSFHDHRKIGFGDSTKRGATLTVMCDQANKWVILESRSDTTWITSH